MTKGNPHKMQSGYRRHQEKVPTSILIHRAHAEEAERIHDLCLDEMEADEMSYGFDPDDFDNDEGETATLEMDDFGYEAFDYFKHDQLTSFPEDGWKAGDFIDTSDRSLGTLRHYMESVRPDEVFLKDAKWVASKYTLLTAMIIGGLFSEEIFDEATKIVQRYSIALENKLTELGIEFSPFIGITRKGWDTFNQFHKDSTVADIGHC